MLLASKLVGRNPAVVVDEPQKIKMDSELVVESAEVF